MRPQKHDYDIAGHWMLADLKDVLDDIERRSEWEHRFVSDLMIRVEENPEYKLTDKQFNKLLDIHGKYR